MKISKIICLFAVLSVISAVYAQDERRQWAIDTNIGFTFFNIKQNPIDHLSSKHGKVTYLGAEYYIPDTHFSLRLGYQNEKIKIIRDMVAPIQESVSAGGRWYPAPYEWRIQPYLGANTTPSSSGSYSTYSTSIKSYKTYLSSVGFNGLPSGTWASGASIRIGFYNSSNTLMSQGLTTHNSLYTTSSKVNFFPSSGTSYRQGGFTNCSRACTAGANLLRKYS